MALYRGIAASLPYGISALVVAELFKSTEAYALGPIGADEGEALGISQRSIMQVPGNLPRMDSGNANLLLPTAKPGSQSIATGNVQPTNGSADDTGSTSATYGNPLGYDSQITTVTGRVLTEGSPPGEVYRTIKGSKKRRINYTNAPFLAVSKTQLETPFTGCSSTTTTTATDQPVELSTTKSCIRSVDTLKNCTVNRNVTINQPPVTGGASYNSATTEKSIFPYTAHTPGSTCDWLGNCTKNSSMHTDDIFVSVDWTNVSTAVVNISCDDGCILRYQNEDTGASYVDIPSTQAGLYPSASCGETGVSHTSGNVDITSIVRRSGGGNSNLKLRLVSCTTDAGFSSGDIIWNVTTPLLEDNGFTQNPAGCWTTQFDNAFCHADNWTCNDSGTRHVGTVPITLPMLQSVGGKAIWSDNSPVTNKNGFETANVCWNATGTDLCNFGVGNIGCFLSQSGDTVCPVNDGQASPNSCAAIEAEGCIWEREGCAAGAFDTATSTCMVTEQFYKCGAETVSIGGDVKTTSTLSCAATRCMGNECGTPVDEHNTDFGLMRGLTANLGSMGQDGDCTASTCQLFAGKKLTCKTAVGGTFDCCNKNMPSVNFMTYMELGHRAYKGGQEMGWIKEMPSVSGYASALGKSLGNNVIASVNELMEFQWITPFETATSEVASAGTNALFADLQAAVINEIGTWMATTFPGSSLGTALFAQNSSGQYVASEGVSTVMKSVSTAFMYVYVAYLVLSIAFECSPDEFELAAQKEMRTCHRMEPSYCSGSTAGVCWEMRTAYCCYSSALSRIIQEQVRKQGLAGLDWGVPQAPNCGGLTPSDLSTVNWNKNTGGVDLDEYIGMMVKADILPESGEEESFYKADNITKNSVDQPNRGVSRGPASPGNNIQQTLKKVTQSDANSGIEADNVRNNATQAATSGFPAP